MAAEFKILGAVEMGSLAMGMDACISSSGAGKCYWSSKNGRERFLNERLNRNPIWLHLPA